MRSRASPPRASPGGSRALLALALAAAFGLSAVREPAPLAWTLLATALLLRRGLARALRRVALAVLPVALGLALASALAARVQAGAWPAPGPYLALALRPVAIALLTLSILARVDLPGALAQWPTLSRLLAVTLAQAHALRLVATESREGLLSRLPRAPGTRDLLRSAGAVTAALLALSARNAREIGEAMRSRGF